MSGGLQQAMRGALSVHFRERPADGGQQRSADRLIVDERLRFSVRAQEAAEAQILVRAGIEACLFQ